ncbi:MAG: IS66 family transposase [Bacteroidales bacterium]|nr:IS66 family transposase [Bacteroidales bacterium]MCF8336809.1 IS66 family transposase [Bacteroidales bacterium]
MWPRLKRYGEDGRLYIDNNLVENSTRPLAWGRNNYLSSDSHSAAKMQ